MTIEARTIQKVRTRIIPFIFVLYIVAFLDRINITFAALTMNKELAITSQQYGLLTGIFFIGYFLFEIPSNLLLHRVGARFWIARILVTWGIVAVLGGFVQRTPVVRGAFPVGAGGGRLCARDALVSNVLVPSARTGAGGRAVLVRHAHRRHFGLTGFGADSGSSALARPQQLAMASDIGGNSSCSLRLINVLFAAEPSRRGQVPDNR